MQTRHYKYLVRLGALFTAASLCLSGCNYLATIGGPPNPRNGLDHVDPTLNLSREDYRHMAAPKEGSAVPSLKIDKGAPPIPKLADILAAPRPPKIGETQLVSIAVTDDVPLKDVLLELAKLADIDIDLDANIKGGIEFIAKDKPFNEVVDRICELAGLRYTMKNGVLHVERDTPYIKNYSLSFLNLDRDSNSTVSLSTNVLSTTVGGGGGGSSTSALNTGSTSSVKSASKGDFWKALEDSVKQVLDYQAASHVSATTMQAEVEAPASPSAPGSASAAAAAGGNAPPASTASKGNSANNTAADKAAAKGDYTINRQAGVLTVNATSKQQELVELMLTKLKDNASAQVLIEAKILEVDLNEEYATGIQWNTLLGRLVNIGSSFGAVLPSATSGAAIAATTTGITLGNNVNSSDIITLLEAFGTVRTLSSPRLHAINNQQSTLTFAKNQVYFTITVTAPTTSTQGGTTIGSTAPTVSSSVQTVPIGVMMTMMPSIDVVNNEVTLSVRPTLSSVVGSEPDPAVASIVAEACVAYLTATPPTTCPNSIQNLTNSIPDVQVRELDSTLKLKSGQSMIIGGLMGQSANNLDQGTPFLSGIPVIGNLFKAVTKTTNNTELVLLIKATIVGTDGDLNKTDQTIFKKFSDDPRPVSF